MLENIRIARVVLEFIAFCGRNTSIFDETFSGIGMRGLHTLLSGDL